MAGGALISGPGQACLDALRCAAFLGQQHPQDLKEALLHTLASSSRTTTIEGEGEAGWLSWLGSLVSAVQGVIGEAGVRGGSRRRRRKKRRRREGGVEEEGQAGEEQDAEETASEEDDEEDQEEEASGAWLVRGAAGGQTARAQQLQQGGAAEAASGGSSQRPEQRGGMEVDPAASVFAPVRPRADRVVSSSWRGGAVRRSAVAEALASGDVVGIIFSFLVGVGEASTGRQSVRQLGQLGLVCRKWREVSLWEAWWGGAAEEMLPASVWRRGEGGAGVGGRGRVLEHGRMLWRERRVWCGEWGWEKDLSIAFEVFDRMDGLQMLSVRGPLWGGYADDVQRTGLGIAAGSRWEVMGRPFSAASRDPEKRRFGSMEDFFERGHRSVFASSVCVRVSVVDERTGRRALLWEEDEEVERIVGQVPDYAQPYVGEGGFLVKPLFQQLVTCPTYTGPQLQGGVRLYVVPVAGQPEGVSEQERLYQLAGGEEHNEQAPFIGFMSSDQEDEEEHQDNARMDVASVALFLRSVLSAGQDYTGAAR